MQPSMVLDRTMFNLYCSTTWLDQAQRKTPWTARVRVRQRQREKSVERKQHGEAQAEGSRRPALHSTHAKRCWIQEVILYAITAGTPWSTIGVSVQEQSPGEFRDRLRKHCKQLLPARMYNFHHVLNAWSTLLATSLATYSLLVSPSSINDILVCSIYLNAILEILKLILTIVNSELMAKLWH